jgi:hypothetical protein
VESLARLVLVSFTTKSSYHSFDGFLSLGFGRPQSARLDPVDEYVFLQQRLRQPLPRPGGPEAISLHGDVYIAGQVQLAQIGRDLISWGERQIQIKVSATEFRNEMCNMFGELNGRLDEWSRLWVWSGTSPENTSNFQAHHMLFTSVLRHVSSDYKQTICDYVSTRMPLK